MLLDALRDVLPAFRARDAADPEAYPARNIATLFELGIIGGPFPPSHGGSGASLRECVDLVAELAAVSPSTALVAAMPLGLAALFATGPEAAPEDYREAWAAQIEAAVTDYRAGRVYAACNSEKGAGGSLAATQTTAKRRDGAWAISGEKILASSGRFAHRFFSTAKVDPEELPGSGVVEIFLVPADASGVTILADWDGFGMRSTESQTVRYEDAQGAELLGFPDLIEMIQPLPFWYCLFAAIPLGCAIGMVRALGEPAPASPAVRLRLAEATMRIEALHAYLRETSDGWCVGNGPDWRQRVLRTKTYVTEQSTQVCASLFALSGGRHYRRTGAVAGLLADAFAGTALRPPLPLALESLTTEFSLGDVAGPA